MTDMERLAQGINRLATAIELLALKIPVMYSQPTSPSYGSGLGSAISGGSSGQSEPQVPRRTDSGL
jgi:hypothetical protein